jgi:hypothetical protein
MNATSRRQAGAYVQFHASVIATVPEHDWGEPWA